MKALSRTRKPIGFDILVRRDWLRLCEKRFLLHAPNIYVGTIREACESTGRGWSAAAKIILAASPTVDLTIPEDLRHKIQQLANGK